MKQNYITAVLDHLNNGVEAEVVLSGLKRTLTKHGHKTLYASVLKGVLRVLEANSTSGTTVTVLSEADFNKQKAVIETALNQLQAAESPTIVEDSSIVGGFVAEANNRRIDQSYKTRLVALYRQVTK